MGNKVNKLVSLAIFLVICCFITNIKMEKLSADTYCEKEALCKCVCATGAESPKNAVSEAECKEACDSAYALVESCVLNVCGSGDSLENGKCIKKVDGDVCPWGYTYSNGKNNDTFDSPEFDDSTFGGSGTTSCADTLGRNATKFINGLVTVLRVVGAIAVIVHGMILLIPAVVAKDAEAFKKATSKCVNLLIVLLIIGIFPAVIKLIGRLLGYDISCIF